MLEVDACGCRVIQWCPIREARPAPLIEGIEELDGEFDESGPARRLDDAGFAGLPGGLKSFLVPVGSEKLTQQVHRLRYLLEKRTTEEYRRPAAQLYDWLIRPLEKELEASQARALIFVPGGAFRSIPMGALYDEKSKQFLIEKYPVAVAPGLTLTYPRHIEAVNVKLLKAGLTQSVQGYPELRFVGTELDAIDELLGGTTLRDEAFVTSALEEAVSEQPYGIVHIASHGEFGGDPESTFLLTYNEKLSMAKLAELVGVTEFRDQPLELLTLSACQTAAGDDRAALGLAGVAVKAGARSTLATLWYIDDEASSQLIVDFYRHLSEPATSRAVALRQAQIRLLRDPYYAHPAFWAPFLLIGSWL